MHFSGKNFQPWHNFSLTIEKLTVLTGASSKGKSAIFRALKGILRNELDAAYIRDPKNEALELSLELEGHTIVASRNKRGKVTYVVDGKPYTSLDGEVPPPLKDLRCGEIRVGEFSFDPMFGQQFDPQFLLDKRAYKPGDLNAILGAFGGTEKLEAGKKEAASRISEKNSEARTLAEEIRSAEERKLKLQELVESGVPVVSQLDSLETEIQTHETRIAHIEQAAHHQQRLLPLKAILESLNLPDTEPVESLNQQRRCLQQAYEAVQHTRNMQATVEVLDSIGADWAGVLGLWRKLVALSDISALLGQRREIPDFTQHITEADSRYADAMGLLNSIKYLELAHSIRQSLRTKAGEIKDLEAECEGLQTVLQALQAAESNCAKCGKPLNHICD